MAGSRSRLGRSGERALRVLFGEGAMSGRSDADLIRGFTEAHGEAAEAAFEAIAARHGPMVLGVCRRVVGDEHAAEDAFQAVFLILARKARTVQVDDSLGRWLHGVARRVSQRAKARAAREIPASSAADRSIDDPAASALRAEVRRMVGQEVARLPRKYREAVALCHLDGLSHDRAAEALGLPVGTVRSRLSRARDLLRVRLTRRGLAPAALAAWYNAPQAEAAVSRALLDSTVKLAAGAKAAVPPAVAALACLATGSLMSANAVALAAVSACLVLGVAGGPLLKDQAGEPAKTPPAPRAAAPATKPVVDRRVLIEGKGGTVTLSDDGGTPDDLADDLKVEADNLLLWPPAAPTPKPPTRAVPLADQLQRIIKEYEDARQKTQDQAEQAKTEFERWKTYTEHWVDEAPFARRVVDLAAEHPKEPASRDALIWVIDKPHRNDDGAYGDEVARAVSLLIKHHADDAETARLGLSLHNVFSRRRDAFLEGVYANAKGREAKGLARLALGRYLEAKAPFVAGARAVDPTPPVLFETYSQKGEKTKEAVDWGNEYRGYRVQLRMLDPDALSREAERLYEEVIAEYADVPYITTHRRDLERRARTTPTDPKQRAEWQQIKDYLQNEKVATLGEVAAGRLDAMRNLVVGKPAPDFEGVGLDGKPVKLSDFRGKVVTLVFWGTTCGPCIRELPDERKLAEAMNGRPFTFLGIVCDDQGDAARRIVDSEKITWPNILKGGEAIAERYHVEGYPSHIVIDAKGVIRAKRFDVADPHGLLDPLLEEAEAAGKK